uniref:Polycistin-related protein Y n=1 Tax=Drosophila pseudoobscura TaxID=7237 RepID=D6PAM4_9MUSC|nr:polycistin-related protein Y [Drosophila pseudoobscura]
MLMQQLVFLISCLCTVVVANAKNELNVHVFINRYNAYGRANIITTLDSMPETWFTTRVTMKVRILVDYFQTNVTEHQGTLFWYRTANLSETLDFYDVKIEKDLPYVKGHFHVSRANFFSSGHFLITAIITTEGLYDNAVTATTYTIVKLMQGNACEPKFDIPSCFDSNRPQYYETSKEIVLRANFSRFCPMDTFIQYHWTLHDSTDARDRIIIPPYSQPNNQTLHVVLLIRSAFDPIRTARSKQKLDFALSPHLINLEVACVRNCEENKYYPGKPIHLMGKCEGVGNKNITKWEWLVDNLPVEGHANRLIYTERDMNKQNVSIHLNVEAAHLYNPSYNYYGEDWIFLEKNIGPTDTKCTIVPRDGYAFETLFLVQCQRSRARFMPLRYCVEVSRVLIIDWQSTREMVVRLLPTNKVYVKICDKFDVCENVELKVRVQAIPIPEKEPEIITDHLARVRHWLEYADWQKAYPLLSLISKAIKTKEMLVIFTDTLAAHVPQSTVELTQLVRLTKNVVVTIQPLDDMKALILARMFHRITSTYKLIVESNDLTLLDEYYEQMTSDMCDMLDIINAEWEYIPKAHCLTESESCININNFGKRLEQLSSLRPLLEHVDNWMYAYWKLSNCLIYMGMETARRLHPHEGPRLIKKDSFTIHMESFDLDYQRSLRFESADSMHTLSFSRTLLRELRRRLRHNEVLISVRSHKISQYWWYPKKRSRTQELVVNAFTTTSMFLPSAPLLEPLKFFARLENTPKIDSAERDRRSELFGGPEEEAYAVIHDNVYTPFEVRMYRTEIYAKSVLKVTFIRAQIDYDVLIRMTNVPKLEDMDVNGATCRVKYGIEQRTNFLLRNRCGEARSAFIFLRASNPSEPWDTFDQNGAYFSFATEIHICRAWNSSGTEHSWQKISCMPDMIKSTNSGVHCSCNVIGDFDVDAMPVITVPVNIKCHLDRPVARRHYDMLIVYVLMTVLTVIYIIHHMKTIRHWDRQLCVVDYYTRELYYRGDIVLRLTFGGRLNAGSSGNIIVSLKSSQGTVQMIVYQDPICKSFLRNSTVSFRIQRELVQVPAEIAIGHDDSGIYPHFFCRTVVLTDMHTGQTQTFLIHKWLRGAPNTSRYISAPVFYFAKTTEKEVYPWRGRFAHILEICMGGWYLFQPIIGPWRIGTHCSSFCRWERSCIFIVKIFVTICIVVQYFGPSYVALSCDPSPKKYHDLSSVFWVALICFITTAFLQAAMEKTILLIGYYDHI